MSARDFVAGTRPRGAGGRFISPGTSQKSKESLANQIRRQKAYMARKVRTKKRGMAVIMSGLIIKGETEAHWLPGETDRGPFVQLLDALFKDKYLLSKRRRVAYLKVWYYHGDPRNEKRALPTYTVRFADKNERKRKVPVLKECRFPDPSNRVEIDSFKQWLEKCRRFLKVSIDEAMDLCMEVFNSYKIKEDRCEYSIYPLVGGDGRNDQSGRLTEPTQPATEAEGGAIPESSVNPPTALGGNQNRGQDVEDGQQTHTHRSLGELAIRLLEMAKEDKLYRSLQLVLNPSTRATFSVLSAVWIDRYKGGTLPETWCDLQRDMFRYCSLLYKNETDVEEFHTLRQYMQDQFDVMRRLRCSIGLPLYEEDTWTDII